MSRPFSRPLAAAVLATYACAAPAALDQAGLDRGIEACTDFYQHVNRKWLEATPIPDDRASWGTAARVDRTNEAVLVAALDEAMKTPPAAGTAQRKVVDYYRSGMDLAAIERAGVKPLQPLMNRVAAVKTPADVARTLGYLHAMGVAAGFGFGMRADAKDSSRYLAQLQQGGLGLPERDYYFKDDDRTKQQREAYLKHVARMLELSGEPAAEARRHAANIFAFESQLAKASRTRVELRDDEKNYNKRTVRALAAETPGFAWSEYLRALNYGGIGMVIGHEITHGFDDTGRKYDARGNLADWWTAEDAKRYEERARRMVKQYAGYEGVEGLKINGELTLGENISDLGGLKIAYLALQKALRDKPQGPIDGLAPEQRFFLSYAQTWRSSMRAEQERMRILTDTHSPPRYRVKGPLANMPEFAQAFSCDAGKTLIGESERANIW